MPRAPSSSRRIRSAAAGQLALGLRQAVDVGLIGCVLVVPLLMGGRHALGQFVLVGLAVAVATAWAAYQAVRPQAAWRPTWATVVLVLGVLLLGLQLAPLPDGLLRTLAPHGRALLPLWGAEGDASVGLGAWRCVSLTPDATRGALTLFLAYSLIFLVTVQRIDEVDDIERLLRWCAVAVIVMAAFGLVQRFAANDKFFWFYEAPYSTPNEEIKGSFTNRNHFAHFLALGIGPLIWWLHHAYRRTHHHNKTRFSTAHGAWNEQESWGYALAVAVGVVLFAGLLSVSRGGNVALFLAATIGAVVCCRAAAVRAQFIGALAASGLLLCVALGVFGYDRVSDRLGDLATGSLEVLDRDEGRRRIWQADLAALPDFALLGAGVGSHAEVYPLYLKNPVGNLEYTNAENGYLQVPLETGAAGAVLLAAGIGFCVFWCVAGLRRAASARLLTCQGAVAAGLAASLVHSAVDFVWYVPGCMAVVAVLAGCACRGWQLAAEPSRPDSPWILPALTAPVTAAILLLGGLLLLNDRLGPAVAQVHWERYLLDLREDSLPTPVAKSTPESDAETREDAIRAQRRRIDLLEQVVARQPGHARAQLALAQNHLRLFDLIQTTAVNPMSLLNIRDAAIRAQSHFSSRDARDAWLRRAVGDHCEYLYQALFHTRAALDACPLQGEGYLYLAELAFLDGQAEAAKRACIEQALRVRPYDGQVLYAAANEAWLAGDPAQWLAHAKKAARYSVSSRKQLFEDLAYNTDPEGLEDMIHFVIEQFQPDLAGLGFLEAACKQRGRPEQLVRLRRYYARTAEYEAHGLTGTEAAARWLVAYHAWAALGEKAQALRCARSALECQPNEFAVRYELGRCLVEHKFFAEAQIHLDWCLKRRSNDPLAQGWYRRALAGRLDEQGRAAARPLVSWPPAR